jgi:hypothetical protein
MIELSVSGANAPSLVDDCWAHLARYAWRLDKDGYVCRKSHGRRIYLHQVVMPGNRYPEFVRDHISRDKMDNRSTNLRWLTLAESAQNKSAYAKNTTGLRGVMPIGRRFRATVRLDGTVHRLGMFDTAEDAGKATEAWRSQHMPFAA